jgi:hypothetical protein
MRSIAKHAVKRSLFAAGAAVLVSSTMAAEQPEGLGTRSPDAVERGIGRAGGDPYWVSQPAAPVPEPLVKAYDKTKEVAGKGYDKTKEMVVKGYESTKKVLTTPPTATGPAHYGRAGGYAGIEKFRMQPESQTYAHESRGTPPRE